MKESGIKNPTATLLDLDISNVATAHWNLSPEDLTEETIKRGLGLLTNSGALSIKTGKFTGRSPKDRFIVKDALTEHSVDWNDINKAFSPNKFDQLYQKLASYFEDKDVFVRDAYACADENYQLKIRLVSEYPWSNQFAYNMFLQPSEEELLNFSPDWKILCAPGFKADPQIDGTRQENFAIINFTKQCIIIGGTGYTGEIKKGIFSVLNYILPKDRSVLSMHCSANMGESSDVAIFFGLSGTGKTTLSADPKRRLIGDDEHGWSEKGVFNFEGGCYAKTIDLNPEKEPQIFKAIKKGAILENIGFYEGTLDPDFSDYSITPNTRVSYPIEHIENAVCPSQGGHPKNIFFLTADAFGILPPISKLTPSQAMYYFISGYTAKVAGTEEGVKDPEATFSACFGAPFLPLHATFYAEMLGQKMQDHQTNVWLVNTGWTGGAFGVGERINLKYTRSMISAALNGLLDEVEYNTHEIFNFKMPVSCPGVPSQVLNPRQTWADKSAYDEKANELAQSFVNNFQQFKDKARQEILEASPKILV